MFHPEGPDGRGVVVPHSGFLGVEADALAYEGGGGGGGTSGAPDWEGHFEADCWGGFGGGDGAGAFSGWAGGGGEGGVEGGGGVVAAHVEALHDGGIF